MGGRTSRRDLFAAAGAVPWFGFRRLAGPTAAPEQEKSQTLLPPIGTAQIAQRVRRTLLPAPGERAILFFDPGYYPDLAAAIEGELSAAGVDSLLAVAFDPPEIVRSAAARPGASQRQDDFIAWLTPVFARANLFLWLPARALHEDRRLEHLVDGSGVRGIHFHWLLPLEGRSAEDVALMSRLYERTILETDYVALSRTQDGLIARLRGKPVRLTSPDGTDLRLFVPADAWFHKNDGDMSPERGKSARSARDREMELPAGALRFIPDPASAEGTLAVRRIATPEGAAEDVRLEFQGGKVRSQRAARGEEALRKQWDAIGGDVDQVGEIVLGTNPLLAVKVPSGELPYFGYGAGAVRVSLGDNWESGGRNRTPENRNLWLFLADASLEAGGKALIQEGRLLAE